MEKGRSNFNPKCTLTGHARRVCSVAYSPDGKHIVSGSEDETVKIWDSTTGKEASVSVCHRPIVCCCVNCSDLRDWSMSRSARHSNPCLVSSISHVFVSGVQIRTIGHTCEGDCICSRYVNGWVKIRDECPVTGHSSSVNSVAYSPDGKHIISGSSDNTVKIWNSATGTEVIVLVCHRPIVCCCVECSYLCVWAMSRSARLQGTRTLCARLRTRRTASTSSAGRWTRLSRSGTTPPAKQ